MHLEQLEYVIEVAKQGAISKAATNLHVSHSAISQAIANLESELGLVIFNRSRSGSICTEDGKTVVKLSYEIMNKITELKELGHKSTSLKGDLKISASSIFFSTFLPEVLYSFKQDYPHVQIEINENDTDKIIESMKNNQFDVGLILGADETLKEEEPRLTYKTLLQSKLMVCVSKHSTLAYNKVVSPEELLQQSLVIRNEKFSKTFWENLFSTHGKGNVLFYSNNQDVIKNIIANNIAVGIFTEFWIKNDPLVLNGEIVPIPYFDNKFAATYLICIQTKNKHLSMIETEFLKCINIKLNEYNSKR